MSTTGRRTFLAALCQRKFALVGCILLVLIVLCAILAPWLAPYSPYEINAEIRLSEPSGKYLLGADHFGRDLLSRVIYGSRMALLIGLGAVGFALIGGVTIGILSAWWRSLGLVLMRGIDVLMAFPSLLLALSLIVILGPGVLNSILAVGAIYLGTTARIVYNLTLKLKVEPFVEISIINGSSSLRTIVWHILPNMVSPLLVQASFVFAFAQLQAASLDFLGLGIPPEIPSWGNMLSESRRYITRAPWLLIFPGIMIIAVSFSLNLVGDFLRDRLDPRFRTPIA